jgi:hypothetical protein
MTGEWAEEPVEHGPPPLGVARRRIEGLLPDDVVRAAGYPEEENASTVVIRDGEVIASNGFSRLAEEGWVIGGATVCADTGLSITGEAS